MASATLIGQTSNTELTVGLIDATGTVTYQWKSSTDGASFSDIAGATNAAFNYSSYYSTVNTTTYIRPVVTANGIEYSDIAVIKVYKVANNTKIDMTFGSDIESIGNNAFYGCTSLATIDFGSVTSIGDYAFASCTSLATLTIGDSVTSIGLDAFYGCNSLATITVSSDNTTFFTDDKSILYQITDTTNNNVTAVLCPPATTITDITIDTVLKNETSYTVTSISYSVYQDCTSLETVTIGDSVTSIGQYAFYGCTSLAILTIGDSVTSIGTQAFASCTSLATLTIGDSVTSIGQDAFAYCTSLATLTIGDSVTSIGTHAFYGCDSLATLTIGDSVTSIGQHAFSGCTSLANIYFLGAKPSFIDTNNFISKSGDTAYYRAGQTGWDNATIPHISKIRRIPTIDPIITTTTITGSCDANLSPVLVYISMNNGLTWFKYTATKDSPTSTTWTLNHKFANRQSFKVSTIANYYNLDINDAQNIYCKSYTNTGYSQHTDTSLSTFTIGDYDNLDDGFAVTFPKGTPSVDVTAIPTKIENPRAGVSITVNDATPIVYKNGADFVNTKSISLNPGENEVTITVTILPSSTEDYTGYIHVLPDAPVITTTFTTGYTNDNTPTLSGTTDAALDTNGENTTVTLYTVTTETITDEDGENTTIETYTSLGEATFTATGQSNATWTFTPTDAFADGTHTIVATAQYSTSVQDEDLNVESDYSNAITFTVDTVAPNKPVIVSTIKTDVISGTAEANSTVLVKKDGDQVATAAVNSAGVWTLKVASIDSYAPAKYSYVGQDTALNVSDATLFDTSGFTIRYPPISISKGKSKTVMPFITGRLSGDTSTVFTVANQYKLTQIGAKASIDRNTGRLTVKASKPGKCTIAVKASSPIYGTKVATVTIVVK